MFSLSQIQNSFLLQNAGLDWNRTDTDTKDWHCLIQSGYFWGNSWIDCLPTLTLLVCSTLSNLYTSYILIQFLSLKQRRLVENLFNIWGEEKLTTERAVFLLRHKSIGRFWQSFRIGAITMTHKGRAII